MVVDNHNSSLPWKILWVNSLDPSPEPFEGLWAAGGAGFTSSTHCFPRLLLTSQKQALLLRSEGKVVWDETFPLLEE